MIGEGDGWDFSPAERRCHSVTGGLFVAATQYSVLSVEAELSISIYGLGREAEFGLVVSLTQ